MSAHTPRGPVIVDPQPQATHLLSFETDLVPGMLNFYPEIPLADPVVPTSASTLQAPLLTPIASPSAGEQILEPIQIVIPSPTGEASRQAQLRRPSITLPASFSLTGITTSQQVNQRYADLSSRYRELNARFESRQKAILLQGRIISELKTQLAQAKLNAAPTQAPKPLPALTPWWHYLLAGGGLTSGALLIGKAVMVLSLGGVGTALTLSVLGGLSLLFSFSAIGKGVGRDLHARQVIDNKNNINAQAQPRPQAAPLPNGIYRPEPLAKPRLSGTSIFTPAALNPSQLSPHLLAPQPIASLSP